MGLDLNIWATDPDNMPEERVAFDDDLEGTFSGGDTDANGNVFALDTYRVSTASMGTANAIAQLLGGTPVETDRDTERFIDVTTARSKVLVIASPDDLTADWQQWSADHKLIHHCDGIVWKTHPLDPDKVSTPCGCPKLFAERKAAAKASMGPKPAIELTFRLADDPELGKFRYRTGSWTLAKVLHETGAAFEKVGGEALVEISLSLVEFTITKGKDKGTEVSYYAPGIKVREAYNDAVAEPPY